MKKNFELITSKNIENQSGQALIGGLFFLVFVISIGGYFIFVSKSIRELYANTLKTRFEKISEASQYSNIFNQIAVNNQNIIISLISAQTAFISGVETGLTVSYEQPYWETYSNFQNINNKSALSEKSLSTIKKTFDSYALSTGRGLYVAKALSVKNNELLNSLPFDIKKFFVQSSNSFAQCLALEFQSSELHNSHYTRFLVPPIYQFGLTKENCALQHKNNFLRKIITGSLPTLLSNDSDFIIDFNTIDEYSTSGKNFSYGITYVNPEFSNKFIQSLKFETKGTLKSIVRISHPDFSCRNKFSIQGNFIVEDDWKNTCEISENHFVKSFFKPNWAALVTYQEKGLRKK